MFVSNAIFVFGIFFFFFQIHTRVKWWWSKYRVERLLSNIKGGKLKKSNFFRCFFDVLYQLYWVCTRCDLSKYRNGFFSSHLLQTEAINCVNTNMIFVFTDFRFESPINGDDFHDQLVASIYFLQLFGKNKNLCAAQNQFTDFVQ